MAQKKKQSNFDVLAAKLAQQPGVTNPGGLAYSIGAKKYGAKTMGQAAQRGVSAKAVQQRYG